MSKKYIILTDSSVDLPDELAKKMDLVVVPLSLYIDDLEYKNYLDESDIKFSDFYDILKTDKVIKTSQISPFEYIEYMEPYLEDGYDILNITFSSALSGTYNSAVIAEKEMLVKYPNRKIYTIDSKSASMGQGLLVTYAYNLKKQGKNLEEVYNWIENNKLNFIHLFTVGDLNHLKKGGRLSSGMAFIGNILKIKPLLFVNDEGELVQKGFNRGRKKALLNLINYMKEDIIDPKNQVIYISHGNCLDDVLWMKKIILDELNVKDVVINFVGPVIGAHSGQDTVAIFYYGKKRE